MPCEYVTLPGGVVALACGARRRRTRPCAYCGGRSSRLCDFPILRVVAGHEQKGPCDVPLCDRCTTRIGGDGDLCRAHAPLWDRQLGRPTVGPGAEPEAR